MGVGVAPKRVGAAAQPLTQRTGNPGGPGVHGSSGLVELEGVPVGANDVAAARDAVVQTGGVLDIVTVAESRGSLVVTEKQRVRVVVDHGVFVRD